MIVQRAEYPARYYVRYTAATGDITGWFDTWEMQDVSFLPSASDMIPVTAAQWADTDTFRVPVGKSVVNGEIVNTPA